MIKASLYLKMINTSTDEETNKFDSDGNHLYVVRCNVGIYTDITKTNMIGQKLFVFNNVPLSGCTFTSIYGMIMATLEDPTIA